VIATIKVDVANAFEILLALEALIAIDRVQIRYKRPPPLYRSGIRYQREAPGREDWQTILELVKHGYGDCEDLAAARVAELREKGELDARPMVRRSYVGYHVLVRRPSQAHVTEDPSRLLGM
jgi:hypothetical protein